MRTIDLDKAAATSAAGVSGITAAWVAGTVGAVLALAVASGKKPAQTSAWRSAALRAVRVETLHLADRAQPAAR